MVFAFNLLLPFETRPLQLDGFEDVEWTGVELEWNPPGDLLSEIAGDVPVADERMTSIDGVLWGRRGESSIALLVEVKLTEGGFTPCSGRNSRGNRDRAPCRDAARMLACPDRCYLTRPWRSTRERRYWRIFEGAFGSMAAAFPHVDPDGACVFASDSQQIMRQHALALALEQHEIVDEAWLVLVHHDRNPDVTGPFDAYRRLVSDASRLRRVPASTWLRGSPNHLRWMQARYRL